MFFDVQFLKNKNKQIKSALNNNFDGVFLVLKDKEELFKPKILELDDKLFFLSSIYLGKSSKYLSMSIFDNVVEFKNNINNYDIFLLDFRKKEDKIFYRNSLLSPSISYLPRHNKILLFPSVFFINNIEDELRKNIYLSNILGRFRQNINILKKKKSKIKAHFSSLNYFEDKEKEDDALNLLALANVLGLSSKEAKYSLGQNIFDTLKFKMLNKSIILDKILEIKKSSDQKSSSSK